MTNEVENFLAQNLLRAVQTENFDMAKVLIEKHNANPYFVVHESGIAPIHFAVCMTNEKAAEHFTKYFLKHNGDPNVKTEDSETPLHIACYYGRLKIVQLLVSSGGDISIKDSEGNSALSITINQGQFEVFDLLKKIIFEKKMEKQNLTNNASTKKPNPCIPNPIIEKSIRAVNDQVLTPNGINYNFDAASPHYVNITHRRKTQVKSQKTNIELPNVQKQTNIFELNASNLEEFQKQNDSISRNSLVNTWKEKVIIDNEINFEEILNKFSHEEASSTKLPKEIEAEQLLDTFHTANSVTHDNQNKSETSFIKSPKQTNGTDELQIVQDYRHVDKENDVVFFERKIEPCGSHSSKHSSQISQASTKITVPSDYNTADLRRELTQFGDSPGPITKSTKYLYMKRLMKYKRDPFVNLRSGNEKITYSIELEKALKENSWQETLSTYMETNLEMKMTDHFESTQFNKQKCRESCLKTSFIYLLIDPRIARNLPVTAKTLEPLTAWKQFLESIFYVGKGKSSRPYSHLYDAIKMYQQKTIPNGIDSDGNTKPVLSDKLKRIIDIWDMEKGVVCLHVFHNIMPAEAYTREAAIIDAIGLNNLTNLKSGSYNGITNTWTMRDRKQLGTTLLYKSYNIFLSEGESQLRPADIK